MTIWVVRAGKYGERENQALSDGRAFIGWGELGDLSGINSREDIEELLRQSDPDKKEKTIHNHASQILNFVKKIEIGDLFALPLKKQRAIAFGKFVSDYEYLPNYPYDARHSRRVEWIGEPILRNSFEQDLLNSLGSAMTVFTVSKNNAEKRIMRVIKNGKQIEIKTTSDTTDSEDENIGSLEEQAEQRISDFISRKFKTHPMEKLVASVLRAQGYEVHENENKGKDGGVDLLAGRGPMGFDQPLLCVQVKSSESPVGIEDYDKLRGVMEKFKATHGLFVSWGGFKGTVDQEAKRDFFKVCLWTGSDLIREIQDVYPSLPKDIRSKLPLKQIWTLVDEE